MKKLKYLLVAFVLPLMMTSCWPEPEQNENDPIYAGVWLYNTAVVQSTYTLDPAAIAFRLNCLLTDRLEQGVPNLSDVLTEAEALEQKFLFGESTQIEENYEGVVGDFRISFDMTLDKGQSDRSRSGAVIISTGGKLLTDLVETGDAWIIEVDEDSNLNYVASTGEQIISEGADSYVITADKVEDDQTRYTVAIEDFECKSNLGTYSSSWRGAYSIIPQTTKTLGMAVARKCDWKMAIAMAGPTFAALDGVNQTNLIYMTMVDNVYSPDCSMSNGIVYRAQGEESVNLTGVYDTESFPSSFATVSLVAPGSKCGKVSAKINYNGEVRELTMN